MNEDFLKPVSHFSICTTTLHGDFQLHWHEFYEFEFIASGKGTLIFNGDTYEIDKGVMYLLTPADFHEIKALPDESIQIYNIKFSDELLSDDLHKLLFYGNEALAFQACGSSVNSMLYDLERLLKEYSSPGTGAEIFYESGLAQILLAFIRNRPKSRSVSDGRNSGKNTDPMQKAIIYMQHHFREPLSLEMVAGRSNLSSNYFSECFHLATGVTFQKYLLMLRLKFARTLLNVSRLSILEISAHSGFNSLPHFNRSFKSAFGLTPKMVRKSKTD